MSMLFLSKLYSNCKLLVFLLLLSYAANNTVSAMHTDIDPTKNQSTKQDAQSIKGVDKILFKRAKDSESLPFVRASEKLGDIQLLVNNGQYSVIQNGKEYPIHNAFVDKEIRGFTDIQLLNFLFNNNYFFVKQVAEGEFSIEGRLRLHGGVDGKALFLAIAGGLVVGAIIIGVGVAIVGTGGAAAPALVATAAGAGAGGGGAGGAAGAGALLTAGGIVVDNSDKISNFLRRTRTIDYEYDDDDTSDRKRRPNNRRRRTIIRDEIEASPNIDITQADRVLGTDPKDIADDSTKIERDENPDTMGRNLDNFEKFISVVGKAGAAMYGAKKAYDEFFPNKDTVSEEDDASEREETPEGDNASYNEATERDDTSSSEEAQGNDEEENDEEEGSDDETSEENDSENNDYQDDEDDPNSKETQTKNSPRVANRRQTRSMARQAK